MTEEKDRRIKQDALIQQIRKMKLKLVAMHGIQIKQKWAPRDRTCQ